jgi:hypothetical protein
MPAPISRRQAVQRGTVVIGRWAVAQVSRRITPIRARYRPAGGGKLTDTKGCIYD